MTLATPTNGGCKATFPRAVGNGVIDLKALRRDIETAETMSERPDLPRNERRRWRDYRDHLERALDVRIDLLDRTAQSHDRVVSKNPSRMCRDYTDHDPSFKVLLETCAGACRDCAPASA